MRATATPGSVITVLLGVCLPAICYLSVSAAARDGDRPRSFVDVMRIDPDTFDVEAFQDTLSPRTAWQHGLLSRHPATEVVAVVVTSSGCIGSRAPEFQDATRRLRRTLDANFEHRGDVVVRTVGVALDWDIDAGVEHLRSLAEFDEITVGGNRLNVASEKYLWGEPRLGGGTPQLLLLERRVTWVAEGVSVEDERLLDVILGPTNIAAWVDEGAEVDITADDGAPSS